jgi:hypothetical protein
VLRRRRRRGEDLAQAVDKAVTGRYVPIVDPFFGDDEVVQTGEYLVLVRALRWEVEPEGSCAHSRARGNRSHAGIFPDQGAEGT